MFATMIPGKAQAQLDFALRDEAAVALEDIKPGRAFVAHGGGDRFAVKRRFPHLQSLLL